jgi:sec-independent protein translocase protein TatA
MGNLGATELIIIVLIVLIFFGSKKIPELAAGLGKGMREFRKATRDIQEDQEESTAELKAPKTDTMACIYCNSRVAKDARFCPSCGKSLEAPRCSKCHRVNTLGAKFCVECGEKL